MSLRDLLTAKRDEVLAIARSRGARNIRLFGSVARRKDSPQSDIDFLVEFEPGRSLLDHSLLVDDLERLFGRTVEIASERGLKESIRDRVLAEAVPF